MGFLHDTLRPCDRDGQPFTGLQCARRFPTGAVACAQRVVVTAGLAVTTGVRELLHDGGAGRQVHAGLCVLDRKLPGVAGDVPVELVVVVEEAQLPVGPVADAVHVFAARQIDVAVTDADAHAVAQLLERVSLPVTVTGNAVHLETDPHEIIEAVAIRGREVPEDAAGGSGCLRR